MPGHLLKSPCGPPMIVEISGKWPCEAEPLVLIMSSRKGRPRAHPCSLRAHTQFNGSRRAPHVLFLSHPVLLTTSRRAYLSSPISLSMFSCS